MERAFNLTDQRKKIYTPEIIIYSLLRINIFAIQNPWSLKATYMREAYKQESTSWLHVES